MRTERRLELAMEGGRWFDLERWGNAVQVMNEYYRTESQLRPYLATGSLDESSVYFPIPLTEVENSQGLYDK